MRALLVLLALVLVAPATAQCVFHYTPLSACPDPATPNANFAQQLAQLVIDTPDVDCPTDPYVIQNCTATPVDCTAAGTQGYDGGYSLVTYNSDVGAYVPAPGGELCMALTVTQGGSDFVDGSFRPPLNGGACAFFGADNVDLSLCAQMQCDAPTFSEDLTLALCPDPTDPAALTATYVSQAVQEGWSAYLDGQCGGTDPVVNTTLPCPVTHCVYSYDALSACPAPTAHNAGFVQQLLNLTITTRGVDCPTQQTLLRNCSATPIACSWSGTSGSPTVYALCSLNATSGHWDPTPGGTQCMSLTTTPGGSLYLPPSFSLPWNGGACHAYGKTSVAMSYCAQTSCFGGNIVEPLTAALCPSPATSLAIGHTYVQETLMTGWSPYRYGPCQSHASAVFNSSVSCPVDCQVNRAGTPAYADCVNASSTACNCTSQYPVTRTQVGAGAPCYWPFGAAPPEQCAPVDCAFTTQTDCQWNETWNCNCNTSYTVTAPPTFGGAECPDSVAVAAPDSACTPLDCVFSWVALNLDQCPPPETPGVSNDVIIGGLNVTVPGKGNGTACPDPPFIVGGCPAVPVACNYTLGVNASVFLWFAQNNTGGWNYAPTTGTECYAAGDGTNPLATWTPPANMGDCAIVVQPLNTSAPLDPALCSTPCVMLPWINESVMCEFSFFDSYVTLRATSTPPGPLDPACSNEDSVSYPCPGKCAFDMSPVLTACAWESGVCMCNLTYPGDGCPSGIREQQMGQCDNIAQDCVMQWTNVTLNQCPAPTTNTNGTLRYLQHGVMVSPPYGTGAACPDPWRTQPCPRAATACTIGLELGGGSSSIYEPVSPSSGLCDFEYTPLGGSCQSISLPDTVGVVISSFTPAANGGLCEPLCGSGVVVDPSICAQDCVMSGERASSRCARSRGPTTRSAPRSTSRACRCTSRASAARRAGGSSRCARARSRASRT